MKVKAGQKVLFTHHGFTELFRSHSFYHSEPLVKVALAAKPGFIGNFCN